MNAILEWLVVQAILGFIAYGLGFTHGYGRMAWNGFQWGLLIGIAIVGFVLAQGESSETTVWGMLGLAFTAFMSAWLNMIGYCNGKGISVSNTIKKLSDKMATVVMGQ